MKLLNIIKCVCILTIVCLVYIHLQVKIIDLAYQGKVKEEQIRKLIDENGNVTYTILTLKSAKNLGFKLLDDKKGMNFLDPKNIINILSSSDIIEKPIISKRKRQKNKRNALLSLLSFGTQAEARAQK